MKIRNLRESCLVLSRYPVLPWFPLIRCEVKNLPLQLSRSSPQQFTRLYIPGDREIRECLSSPSIASIKVAL